MLRPLWVNVLFDLMQACKGRSGAAFRRAAAHIVPTGYTNFDELETEIGSDEMSALVASNLLAVRPPSDWARDLPLEAYGPHMKAVATAASATALFCMRMLQEEGRLAIKVKKTIPS